MIKIREAIVVEGRYDKNTLSQIVDTVIFQTDGFGIFKDKEKMDLLRLVAQKRGLIVFTDADGAGFVIRNRIKSAIDGAYLKHAYTPDIFGKESRKKTAGKEGKLGVEGMDPQIIVQALEKAGATILDGACRIPAQNLSKVDFVFLGLSGGPGSKQKRQALIQMLSFPEHMSANALLQALNVLYTKEEVYRLVDLL